MSPEPTGVHGLLKQRKLFTHKYISYFSIIPKCNRVSGLFMHTLMQRKYATKNGASAA